MQNSNQDGYQIDVSREGNTWTYDFAELNNPGVKDISNWLVELPGLDVCYTEDDVTISGPSDVADGYIQYNDPNAGFDGAKWEGMGGFSAGEFTITVNSASVVNGEVQVFTKGGTSTDTQTIAGPTCATY
jgi:hypothetical protein